MMNPEVTCDWRSSLELLVSGMPEAHYHRRRPLQRYKTYHHPYLRRGIALGIMDLEPLVSLPKWQCTPQAHEYGN